jgi:hypothetical protein
VKEEIAILVKEGFRDISEDDIVELLESRSLPLTNEEMAVMDMRMYKEAQNDGGGGGDGSGGGGGGGHGCKSMT